MKEGRGRTPVAAEGVTCEAMESGWMMIAAILPPKTEETLALSARQLGARGAHTYQRDASRYGNEEARHRGRQ